MPSIELRTRQSLALTPRLQQSVRLLQLSSLEFQQELRTALDTNPFLEYDSSETEDVALATASTGDEGGALPAADTVATAEPDSLAADSAGSESLESSGPDDVPGLAECEKGEDVAKKRYHDALEKDLPVDVRAIVERQYQGVLQNHDRVRDLRDQYASRT